MKLKICGINDPDFAAEAAKRGVDFLGFIFHPSSPRNITPEKARTIVAGLSGRVRCVGVFVNQSVSEIREIMREVGLDVVQLHRRALPEEVLALRDEGYELWTLAGGAEGDGVLFDSSHGDGETDFRRGDYQAILAGRIGVENLQEARALNPDILDVNSSLESSPGVKDIAKLTEFLSAF